MTTILKRGTSIEPRLERRLPDGPSYTIAWARLLLELRRKEQRERRERPSIRRGRT